MLADYLPILILFILAAGVAAMTMAISGLLGPRRPSPQKLMPYESGMQPIGPAQRRVGVQFYLIATLFILFDIEIVFLYPLGVVLRRLAWFGFAELAFFLAILAIAYVFIWRKGALEWR